MTIGEQIYYCRTENHMTQKQLGEKAGIDPSTIRKYESGRLNPKIETVKKIAAALGVPINIFYPIDDEIEKAEEEARNELWAAEELAKDQGEPWDIPTYNRQREVVIMDMSTRYSVPADTLFAKIPLRTEEKYSTGAEGSAKNKAYDLFCLLPSEWLKKQAVSAEIDGVWERYNQQSEDVFKALLSLYHEDDANTKKLAERLESLTGPPQTPPAGSDEEPASK